jgi:hypothetical protein
VNFTDPMGLAKGNGYWDTCKGPEIDYCKQKCGSRGVKNCYVYVQFVSTVTGGKDGYKWRRPKTGTGMQCNCNDECPNSPPSTFFIIPFGVGGGAGAGGFLGAPNRPAYSPY